ncbi:EGF-like domain containing protein 2 [Mizuhopecten yessoensis]|uniref:EGF-like domain containing protein 2 n=1 Tax=Mizuhopecten yessoensis TaxID=6573 RepID=A0A210QC91_MIZYE|nr:EGF-like domain containing protein 2 [Mizuhopecten yessoensis]XP_021361887.1 EGF-like domain containing protein 2 [Mizuhopecten yessoensis]XP_021361888.1 EGF-like domain containing protein 2 [Mizuhopecten yessoensis]XP_021361889.1 EGF-like domain containing protein 2 [Mizuhopecten yessoensis]OWF46348.1 EGF-like domain containing protein 2 [Mizuhopecten yessoensis]
MSSFILFSSLLVGLTFVVLVNSYCQRPGFYCQQFGRCSENQTCECPTGFRGFDCRIPKWVPTCVNNCSGHGQCVTTWNRDWCYCDYGYFGKNCETKNDTIICGSKNITIVTHVSSDKAVVLHGHPMCMFSRVPAGRHVYKYELTVDRMPPPGHPCAGALHTMVIDSSTTVQMFHVEIQSSFGIVTPLDWITEFECTYRNTVTGSSQPKLDVQRYEVKLLDSQYEPQPNGEVPIYNEFSLEFTPTPSVNVPDAHAMVWDLKVYDAEKTRPIADILVDGCLTIAGEERLLGPPAALVAQRGVVLTFAPVNKDTYLFFDYKVKICDGQCPQPPCAGKPIPKNWIGFNVHVAMNNAV